MRWLLVAAATVAASLAAGAAGLPSPSLFAALVVGLVYALRASTALAPAPPLVVLAQALLGVTIGAALEPETLAALGAHWISITVVSLATLGASLAAGLALARTTRLDDATAQLGMVAGGASGIVAMSDDLGADARLVAFMQYLRVLVVVLVAPLVVAIAFGPGGGGGEPASQPSLVLTIAATLVGLALARGVAVPAGAVLWPLLVAAVLSGTGALTGDVPAPIQAVAFAVIGLEVGLRFTRETVALAGRLLPAVLAAIGALVAVCAGFAALLAPLADVTYLDAYLATTPGGLYAVLAAAFGSQADTTFVLAVQTLRLLVMILAAPLVVRALARRRSR